VALLALLGRTDTTSARRRFGTKRVVSDPSTPLPTTAGGLTNTFADCGGTRKPISCGFIVGGNASQLVNALVTFAAPIQDETQCGAALFRTAAGATEGATIQAVAVCRV
jgi:hypothetical protein